MVIVPDVVKKGIDSLSIMVKVIEMLRFKDTLRVHQVDLRLEKI